jgi:hypothetical protein
MQKSTGNILPKTLFAAVLLFALFFQSLVQIFFIVQFEINKEEIIKNSCIQKDAPKNCCQGSCQINAKLKVSKVPEGTESEAQPSIVFPEVYFEQSAFLNFGAPHNFKDIRADKNVYFKKLLLNNIDPPPPKCFS